MYQKSTLKACKISLTNVTPINLIKSSERKEGTTSISPREVKNKVGQGLKLQRSRLKFYFSDKVSADNVGVWKETLKKHRFSNCIYKLRVENTITQEVYDIWMSPVCEGEPSISATKSHLNHHQWGEDGVGSLICFLLGTWWVWAWRSWNSCPSLVETWEILENSRNDKCMIIFEVGVTDWKALSL